MRMIRQIVLASVTAGFIASAHGEELKIGLSAEPCAMDPHFHNLPPNNSLLRHIFERLTQQDENQRVMPGLAVSWRTIDDSSWEFKLRRVVKFTHDPKFTVN